MEISRRTHSIQYMDTSPSELMHTFPDKILVHSLINYYDFDMDKVNVLQFKNTRKDRKQAAQQRIIDSFELGWIRGCGVITYNSQLYAMENARKFLIDAGYLQTGPLDLEAMIEVAGHQLKVGIFLSLTWYALCLGMNFRTAAIFTQVENKDRVFIALDFLSGDNDVRFRNLAIIKELTRHTQLAGLFSDAVNHYKVHVGYGYAGNPDTGKGLKSEGPLCVSDWITYSFYARLRRKNVVPDERHAGLEPFTALADYLVGKNFFKEDTAIRFTDEI